MFIITSGDSGCLPFKTNSCKNPSKGWVDIYKGGDFFYRVYGKIEVELKKEFTSIVDEKGVHWGEFEIPQYYVTIDRSAVSSIKPGKYSFQVYVEDEGRLILLVKDDMIIQKSASYSWRDKNFEDLFIYGNFGDVNVAWGDLNITWRNMLSL